MEYIVLARWFGFVSVILSLGILFNQEDAKEMAKKMSKDESGYIMGGVLPIIFGSFSLMLNHAFDVTSWQIVVTLVSLMMLFMGMYRVFFVKHWKRLMYMYIDQIPPLFSLFGLIFGILLLYVGFVSHIVSYEIALADL